MCVQPAGFNQWEVKKMNSFGCFSGLTEWSNGDTCYPRIESTKCSLFSKLAKIRRQKCNDFKTTYRRCSMLKMGPNKARKGDRRLTFTRQGGWGLFYRCMCYLKYQPFLSLSLFYSLVLARNMEHTVTTIIIHTRSCMYNQPLLLHNTMIGSRQLKVFNYYMEGENVLWWKIRDRADGPNVRYNTVTKI